MSETRITKLVDKIESLKNRTAKMKEKGEEMAGRVVHSTLTTAGGAAVGAMRALGGKASDGYKVYVPGTHVQADLALGMALTGASVMGIAGKYSDYANSLGSGMLAVIAAEKTQEAILGHSKK